MNRLKDYLKKTPSDKRLLDEAVDLYKRTAEEKLKKLVDVGQRKKQRLVYTNLETLNKEEGVFDVGYFDDCLNVVKYKMLEDAKVLNVSKAAEEEILDGSQTHKEADKKDKPAKEEYFLYGKDGKFVVSGVDMEDELSKLSHELGKALGKDDPIYDMLEENGRDLKDILREADAEGIKFANEADFKKEIQRAREEMEHVAEMEISPFLSEEVSIEAENIEDIEVPEEEKIYDLYEKMIDRVLPEKEVRDLYSQDVELTPKARAVLLDHLQKEAYKDENIREDGRDITVKITEQDLRRCNKVLLNKAVEEFEKRKAEEIQDKGISESLAGKQVTGENMYRAAKKVSANASDKSMDLRAYSAENSKGQKVVVKGSAKKIREAVASQEHVPANKAILNNIQNQHD